MKNYTDEEFEEIFEDIYLDLTQNVKKSKNKEAFILGGQPGAGKSGLTALIKKDKEVIIINGDEFRKAHPHYKKLKEKYGDDYIFHTQYFSGKITEALIKKVSDEGYNLVIEGTLRTVEVPLKTCEILKNKNYKVNLNIVQVRPEFSLLGTFQRYEKMLERGTIGRETPIEHHNKVVENISKNLDYIYRKNIFDNIEIFDREGNNIYSQKVSSNISPCESFDNFFGRDLTKEEIQFLDENYTKVLLSMKNRKASKEKIQFIENIKNKVLKKL